MPGKIGIRIPSHNSLTPSFFDELMKRVVTSRKETDAHKIRRRFEHNYHIAIVSTGLSYLEYLGALKKTLKNYRPTQLGKKIGKCLVRDHLEEANAAWRKLLKRHKLYGVFKRYFTSTYNQHGTLEEFGRYLRKRAHAKWKVDATRSRVSRLCELFADKELIEFEHNHLTLVNFENLELSNSNTSTAIENSTGEKAVPNKRLTDLEATDSWPIKIEIKIAVSNQADPRFLENLLSFIKDTKVIREVNIVEI